MQPVIAPTDTLPSDPRRPRAEDAAAPVRVWATVVRAVASGIGIAFIGVLPLALLAPLNAAHRPEWPWAAGLTAALIFMLLMWLNGHGWPRSTAAARRFNLRLWRPAQDAWSPGHRIEIFGLVGAIVALYALWVVASPARLITDFSSYPTTAYRISLFVMGALVSGVVEEMAFRGYMQRQMERIGPAFAVLVTSVAFTLAHAGHGLSALLVMAPGYFIMSVCLGQLAIRTGSIVPGMFLHVLGDASHTFFVLLGGDGSLLIATP